MFVTVLVFLPLLRCAAVASPSATHRDRRHSGGDQRERVQLAAAQAALAGPQAIAGRELPQTIVVTATRVEQPISEIGTTVTVVDAQPDRVAADRAGERRPAPGARRRK